MVFFKKHLFSLLIIISANELFATEKDSKFYDPEYIIVPIITIILTFAFLIFSLYLIRRVFRELNPDCPPDNFNVETLDKNNVSKYNRHPGLNLIIRGIYLLVVLKFWSIISSTITYVYLAVFYEDYYSKEAQKFIESLIYSHFSIKFINILPELGKWLIFISIGFPLLRDLHKYLNIDYKNLLFPRKK